MQRPISKVDTYVSNIDEIRDIFIVSYQNFEMTLGNIIRFWSGGTAAFFMELINSVLENIAHLD